MDFKNANCIYFYSANNLLSNASNIDSVLSDIVHLHVTM